MSAATFTPAWSIRLWPEVCIEHGADKLLQLLRGGAVQQHVDDLPIVIGEAQAGERAAAAAIEVTTFDRVGEHGDVRLHRRLILSLVSGPASVAEAGERSTFPGGRPEAAE